MKKHILLLIAIMSIFLSACSIYKQEFDCEPPKGVPCTSETDLEAMIIETNKGPDLFLPVEVTWRGFLAVGRFLLPACSGRDGVCC